MKKHYICGRGISILPVAHNLLLQYIIHIISKCKSLWSHCWCINCSVGVKWQPAFTDTTSNSQQEAHIHYCAVICLEYTPIAHLWWLPISFNATEMGKYPFWWNFHSGYTRNCHFVQAVMKISSKWHFCFSGHHCVYRCHKRARPSAGAVLTIKLHLVFFITFQFKFL